MAGETVPAGALPATRALDLAGSAVRLWLVDAALACCAMEVWAAQLRGSLDTAGWPLARPGSPPAQVLVVSGTLTHRMAPQVTALYRRLAAPRYVLAYGACAATGGPYWDSYAVVPGAGQLVPVDAFVPGCPPRPEDLAAGLATLPRRESS